MKFLVSNRPKPNAVLNMEKLGESRSYLMELQESGVIEVMYGYVTGGSMMILNVESNEDLWHVLHKSPIYLDLDWELTPLVEAQKIIDNQKLATNA